MTKQEKGGRIHGHRERIAALARYNTRPHFCKQCFKKIEVGERRVPDIMDKKFCNQSCATTYSNAHRAYHTLAQKAALEPVTHSGLQKIAG